MVRVRVFLYSCRYPLLASRCAAMLQPRKQACHAAACAAWQTVLRCGRMGRFRCIVVSTARGAILQPPQTNQPNPPMAADLSRYLVIDASTGTVLTAATCYLIDDDSLTPAEWELMDSCSDSELASLARNRGRKLADLVTLRAKLPGER